MYLLFEPSRFSGIPEAERLSTMINIGINGFGRIGCMAFRAAIARKDAQVVAVNDVLDPRQLAHLLKYDSVRGRFGHDVVVKDGYLVLGERGGHPPLSPARPRPMDAQAVSPWMSHGAFWTSCNHSRQETSNHEMHKHYAAQTLGSARFRSSRR